MLHILFVLKKFEIVYSFVYGAPLHEMLYLVVHAGRKAANITNKNIYVVMITIFRISNFVFIKSAQNLIFVPHSMKKGRKSMLYLIFMQKELYSPSGCVSRRK